MRLLGGESPMPIVGMDAKGGQGDGGGWSVAWAKHDSDAGTTSHNIPLPGDYAAGDLLMILGNFYDGSVSNPSGWTALVSAQSPSGVVKQRIWYKTATGSEGASVTVSTGSGTYCAAVALRLRGSVGVPVAATSVNTASPPNLNRTTPLRRLWMVFWTGLVDLDYSQSPPINLLPATAGKMFLAQDIADDLPMASVVGFELSVSSYNPPNYPGVEDFYSVLTTLAVDLESS